VGKAIALGEEFGVEVNHLDAIGASDAAIIINTTPVGMSSHDESASVIPADAWHGRSIAYDLVYNPLETRFLADARQSGCQIVSGIEMLVAQAARQFELWTGRQPSIETMRQAALEKVSTA
jgi:shikimate 5-dehydrogenase